MEVLIDNQQKNHPIEIKAVQRKAQVILNALDCTDGELSLVFVDDSRMADLNVTYLNRQGPTNVLAFPMREGDFGDLNPHLVGDVVISMDTCAREAQQADISLDERLDQLIVHGILHLFGYDHVHTQHEARIMEAKTQALLAVLQQETGRHRL